MLTRAAEKRGLTIKNGRVAEFCKYLLRPSRNAGEPVGPRIDWAVLEKPEGAAQDRQGPGDWTFETGT